jgi:two-component system sensor histidine kinase PilS (NtrC family)
MTTPDPNTFRWHREQPLQKRTTLLLSAFRFLLSLIFVLTIFYIDEKNWLTHENQLLFFKLSVSYFIFSTIAVVMNALNLAESRFGFPIQIVADIVFILLLMHVAGGMSSGLGILLILVIVTASLISQGRLALFYAAVATIGLLLEHSYQIFFFNLDTTSYSQPVMLGLSCFATAWLAHSLGNRMQQSEALASTRSIDLENMAQINARITEEMQDGVLVIDEDSNVRHFNAQAQHLLSLPQSENLHLNEHLPEIATLYHNWLNSDEKNSQFNLTIQNQELRIRLIPISQAPASRHLGAVILIQDWGQLQSKAQQAKLAALGRLTANIAHEVRNPLSAISHANQLLQEEPELTGFSRILQIIEDNIHRIDKIIKDVLELNRRDRTHQEPIELNKFMLDFYTQFCAVEKITPKFFNINLLTSPATILFDQRHLTQILWNLCKNGLEHGQKQAGSLSLQLYQKQPHRLHVEITDDGAGVSQAQQTKLFEPFYTTKSTGSGLGLYISRELAEANGAQLLHQPTLARCTFSLLIPMV